MVSNPSYADETNGNMTTRVEGRVTYAQIFDAETHLAAVTAGGQTTAFTYDGDGQRVKKVDAGGTTYYVGGYYEVQSGVVTSTITWAGSELRCAPTVCYTICMATTWGALL